MSEPQAKKYRKTRIALRVTLITASVVLRMYYERKVQARLDKIDDRLDAHESILASPVINVRRDQVNIPKQRPPSEP